MSNIISISTVRDECKPSARERLEKNLELCIEDARRLGDAYLAAYGDDLHVGSLVGGIMRLVLDVIAVASEERG